MPLVNNINPDLFGNTKPDLFDSREEINKLSDINLGLQRENDFLKQAIKVFID